MPNDAERFVAVVSALVADLNDDELTPAQEKIKKAFADYDSESDYVTIDDIRAVIDKGMTE